MKPNGKYTQIRAMLAQGHTEHEISQALGMNPKSLKKAIYYITWSDNRKNGHTKPAPYSAAEQIADLQRINLRLQKLVDHFISELR